MIVVEFKLKGKPIQFQAIDEAIQTAQFVRNKCLRYWMDHQGVTRAELYRYNTQLRSEFPWSEFLFVEALNAHACQAAVGIDLGLHYFIADSRGHTEPAPQFYWHTPPSNLMIWWPTKT